jgi:hypothetical protein
VIIIKILDRQVTFGVMSGRRWTAWVTIVFKDGSRYCFNQVHEIDALKEATNFIYLDFIKYNVRIKINPQ